MHDVAAAGRTGASEDAAAVTTADVAQDAVTPARLGVDAGTHRLTRQLQAEVVGQDSRAFEIVHAGALYYGRSIASFLDAAQRLMGEDASFQAAFRLTLIGSLDATAHAELARHPVAPCVRLEGQLPHAAVIRRLRAASVLLLVANTTPLAESTVPGKLFEYLAVERPILALSPRASSTVDVLERTGGAWLAPGDDVVDVVSALREAFASWREGRALSPDPQVVRRYDRTRLAGELARVFDAVLGARTRGG
jgi:hypothetical protein